MRIMNAERNISPVLSLDDGDIFEFDGCYYIACGVNYVDSIRECFNLSTNNVVKFHNNPMVEYWHSANVKLLLSDKEC